MSDVTWFTAVHEAAHIVVAQHCGVPVKRATTIPEGDSLGYIVQGEIPKTDSEGGIQKDLAISYAGVAATLLLFSTDWGAYGDLRNIEGALEGLTAKLNAHHKRMAFDMAKTVVRDRRTDILWFADHLYNRRSLDEAQIEQLWKMRNGVALGRLGRDCDSGWGASERLRRLRGWMKGRIASNPSSTIRGIKDINEKGFYIVTNERWPLGSQVNLTLRSTDGRKPIVMKTKVAYWGNDGVGLEYMGLTKRKLATKRMVSWSCDNPNERECETSSNVRARPDCAGGRVRGDLGGVLRHSFLSRPAQRVIDQT